MRREEVVDGDVDAVARGAVDDPSGTTEAVVGYGGVDGAIAGFGGADPALFSFRCDDSDGVSGAEEREDDFVEEDAADAVVVGDEEVHG